MERKTSKQILSMVDADSRNDLINRLMSRSEKLLQLASAMYDKPYSQVGKANVREAIEDAQSAFDTLNEFDAASQREQGMEDCKVCQRLNFLNGYGECGKCADKRKAGLNFVKHFDLKNGDRVRINGREFNVKTAIHYGKTDGWYIETFRDDGTYGYWKQGIDGGTIEKVNRPPWIK
jgi:hypothetical protein